MGKDCLNEKGEILTSEPADRFEESLPLLQAEGWSPSTRITSPITSQAKITRPLDWDRNMCRTENAREHNGEYRLSV
jgi:hypothetical protein